MDLLYIIGMVMLAASCVFLFCRCYRQCRHIRVSNSVNNDIFRSMASYVMLADPDFNVLKTNYYNMTGTTPKAVPPKVGNLLHCKNGEDAGTCGTHDLCADCPVRSAIAGAFRAKAGFSGIEAPMILYTSDDRTQSIECDVLISGNYIRLGGGGKPHMVLTVNDITAQKNTQRQLEKARLRAEEADRMKTLFLANTSHELRTPLNAIVGFSELLASDPSAEERQEYLRIIRTNNELLLQLVSDILDLSKIEAGELEYEYSDVELNTIMEEQEHLCRLRQPPDSPTTISFHRKYPSCYLHTDRNRLSQVIANLLSNAVKFTARGSIDFGYDIRGREVRIYVSDTGTGIPEEVRGQLFKRFVKAGSHKQGIGIGLAISKSIVKALGGEIGFESEAGKGSTFWFTLPYEPK